MLDAPSYVAGYMQGKAAGGGGGGDITVESLSVTENGTTTAPAGTAFNPVVVNVPAQIDWDGFMNGTWPTGDAVLSDSVTDIATYAFFHDSAITSISGPEVLAINVNGLTSCSAMVTVNFPKLTRIGKPTNDSHASYVFAGCKKIRTIHLPELLLANNGYNFSDLGENNGLVTIVLPKLTFASGHFCRATKAEAVDLGPNFPTIPSYSFYTGTYNNIILRRTAEVVAAQDSTAISSIGASTKVWVPSALIDSYKAASNWSAKGDIFYAIEGSIYEHAYADGTPIPTT